MYKDNMVASIKSAEEKDLPVWATLLHITLMNVRNQKDLMEIVQLIINKFDNKQLQIKLLKHAHKGTNYKNVFDVMSQRAVPGSMRLWEYGLSLMNSKVHYKVLLKP